MLSPAMRTAHRWRSMSFSKTRAICGGWSKEKEFEYMETGVDIGRPITFKKLSQELSLCE